MKLLKTVWILGVLVMVGCEKIIPEAPAESELLDGPMEGLTFAEQGQFLAGDIAFNDQIFTVETGLGPTFVANSCGSCHAGDGKGHPFTTLTRFGQTAPNQPASAVGAPQLQNRAIPGHLPEELPPGVPSMDFTPPAVTGLGLLSALTDEQILAQADPDDLDGDGISGVPNMIVPPDYFVPLPLHQGMEGTYVGRFGKKGAAIDLLQQTVGAYKEDMGINSTFEPIDPSSGLSMDPEVSDKEIRDVVFYLRTLKAPIPRDQDHPSVQAGRQLFDQINCSGCHTPSWTTGPSDIEALANRTFHPYTDLLLHDMGPGLDDQVTEGSAETYEWKTPALWGLGLSPDAQGGSFFLMHDGRARSIEEAISMHGGEAAASRDAFQALSASERDNLLQFLHAL